MLKCAQTWDHLGEQADLRLFALEDILVNGQGAQVIVRCKTFLLLSLLCLRLRLQLWLLLVSVKVNVGLLGSPVNCVTR